MVFVLSVHNCDVRVDTKVTEVGFGSTEIVTKIHERGGLLIVQWLSNKKNVVIWWQ